MNRKKPIISDGGPGPDNSKARKIVENLHVLGAKVFMHADRIPAEDLMKILQIAKRTGVEVLYPDWIDKESLTEVERWIDLIVDDALVQAVFIEIASNIDYYISSDFLPDKQDMKDAETLSEIVSRCFS